jgi:hypothetical protein
VRYEQVQLWWKDKMVRGSQFEHDMRLSYAEELLLPHNFSC